MILHLLNFYHNLQGVSKRKQLKSLLKVKKEHLEHLINENHSLRLKKKETTDRVLTYK